MKVNAGSTDVTTYFSLVTTAGADATALTITDIDLQYVRSGVAPVAKVDATALAATDSAHGDNQAIEIDATDQPGLYRVDWPDAAFAAGVREVVLSVKAAGIKTAHLRVELGGGIANEPVNVEQWNAVDVTDLYTADISFCRDQANTQDEWTVTWFKNGVRVTTGITSPTIQVIKRADGSDLVASTAMTQIGSTGSYKKDCVTTERITIGEAVVVVVGATIDGSARSFARVISRDSS